MLDIFGVKIIRESNLTRCMCRKNVQIFFFWSFWLEKLGMIFNRYGKCWNKCILRFTIITNLILQRKTYSVVNIFCCGLFLGGHKFIRNQIFQHA